MVLQAQSCRAIEISLIYINKVCSPTLEDAPYLPQKIIIMKKILSTVLLLALCALQLHALPAKPVKRIVTLDDGTKVELTLRGDEDYHFWVAADGTAFEEHKGRYIPVTRDEVNTRWAKHHKVRGSLAGLDLNTLRAKKRGDLKPGQFSGQQRGLVILVDYADKPMSVQPTPKAFFNDFFNKVGYNQDGNTGSVRDYFYDQSYGKFDLRFDVVGPIRAKHQMAYYGQNDEDGHDMHARDLIVEAVEAAADSIDYKNYDWDGDGVVEHIFIVYAGNSEAEGADPNTIWPHMSTVAHYNLKFDGVSIATYACASEFQGANGTVPDGVGSACHEFSHCLGLPDTYDVNYSGGVGVESWDVMHRGCYNNSSRTPSGHTSFAKMLVGWLDPVELDTMTPVSGMRPLDEAPEAYIMYNEGNRDEFYMLENRQPVKWDAALPGHGLLVYHVDYNKNAWKNNTVNVRPDHQRFSIIPADGRFDYYTQSGDPFPGIKRNTMLNMSTTPAATVYAQNVDGSYFMHKNIDSVEETDNGLISFVACRPDPVVPALNEPKVLSDNSFSVSWTPGAEGTIYEVFLEEYPAVAHDKEASRYFENDMSKFYAAKAGFTDVASKLTDYLGVGGWTGGKLFCTPDLLRIGTNSAPGYLVSPTCEEPKTSELTFAVSVKLFDSAQPLKGYWYFVTPDGAQNIDFEQTTDGLMILHLKDVKDIFRVGFYPESRVYVNHIYLYDGYWTEEELLSSSAKSRGPLRSNKFSYTTEEPTMTFKNLESSSRYEVKVRAFDGYVRTDWSEVKSVSFGADAILAPISDEDQQVVSRELYDMNGRKLDANAQRDSRGIFIEKRKLSNGKVITRKIAF